jgi:hypothetical protein
VIIVIFAAAFPTKEEVHGMSKLRNVYLYLVTFVSLMMILMGTIFTVQNIMDVIFPTNNYYEMTAPEKTGGISEEQKRIYEENRSIESKKNVAKSVAVIVVGLPTFIYHWRKVEKERLEQR